ncbi:MAG: circadian clock KaiB family protein [Deltaproteobacteria bacterium]|nr:circadian clock KaiB family protein [Deltaproteobacteria bacterium]MBF0523646.1 circadian clock KaiB family protein [Deltaproteobacteria bacterium]
MDDHQTKQERATEAVGNSPPHLTRHRLTLYVAGTTPSSLRAIENIRLICQENFDEKHELEVVDIYQRPELAEHDQIIAIPTLISKSPNAMRRIIGDLSNTDLVLVELGVRPKI